MSQNDEYAMKTRDRSKHRKHTSSIQQGGKSAQSCKTKSVQQCWPWQHSEQGPQLVQHGVRELIHVACPGDSEIDRASLHIGESLYS